MAYLTKSGEISFENIGFNTPREEAETMRNEIIKFFKKNPNEKLNLQFGGFARLSKEFADELFKDRLLHCYLDKMVTWEIHIFDQLRLAEAMNSNA